MMMGGGGGGPGGPGGGGGGGGQTPGKATGKVTAAADDRTNTLVVTAPPDTLKLVDQLLKILDSDPAAVSEVKVFQLKFADSSRRRQAGEYGLRDQHLGSATAPAGPTPPLSGLADSLRGGSVTAASDDRTNTLVITAPTEAMRIITAILGEARFQPFRRERVFYLPFAERAIRQSSVGP